MIQTLRRSLVSSLALAAALSAQERPAAGEERIARIYDLQGLVDASPAPAEPRLELGAGAATQPSEPQSNGGPAAIARLVAAFVQPALKPGEVVQPLGERWLVLLGRAAQHAWTDRFLETAKTRQQQLISIDCQLYSMPELVFQKHVAPVLSPAGEVAEPNAGERTTVVLEPGEGTRSFRAALGELDEVDRLDVPSVTVRPLAPAHVTTTNQTAYVRDFEVEVREGAVIADPIVDVVQDGVSIQTSAVPLDGGRIGLSVEVEVADLQRPIPTFETTIGAGGAPVTIQLPQVLSRKVEAAVQLPARHTVVVVLPGMAGARYLVTFEVAEQAATGRDR